MTYEYLEYLDYLEYGSIGLIIITEFALMFLIFPTIKKDDDDGSAHK